MDEERSADAKEAATGATALVEIARLRTLAEESGAEIKGLLEAIRAGGIEAMDERLSRGFPAFERLNAATVALKRSTTSTTQGEASRELEIVMRIVERQAVIIAELTLACDLAPTTH